jgi:hypothetical protein
MISHSLIERESDIFNPGLGPEDLWTNSSGVTLPRNGGHL